MCQLARVFNYGATYQLERHRQPSFVYIHHPRLNSVGDVPRNTHTCVELNAHFYVITA